MKRKAKAFCMWCGHDHQKVRGLKCDIYSKSYASLIKQGAPDWALAGMLHKYGVRILEDSKFFEECAEEFVKHFDKKERNSR